MAKGYPPNLRECYQRFKDEWSTLLALSSLCYHNDHYPYFIFIIISVLEYTLQQERAQTLRSQLTRLNVVSWLLS